MSVITRKAKSCKSVPVASAKSEGQARISCPFQIVSGVDTLELSLHLSISDYSIFEKLSSLKAQIQSTLGSSAAFNFGQKEYFRWNLQRIGTKLYPYVLKSGDVSLLLSSRPSDSPIPNCKIEIGSISAQDDVFNRVQRLIQWLSVYGFTVQKEVISRVDLSCDCLDTSISDLGVEFSDRWITRARKYSVYYDDWQLTGIMIGKGKIALRIYDKALELKRNAVKSDFFYDLWNLPLDSEIPVTRVEFQFRRELLKNLQIPINTISDLKRNLDSLWQYSTTDWARLCEKTIDRKNNNQKQAKVSEFWKKIQAVIFVFPSLSNRRLKRNLVKNLDALRAQARGCLLNVAAAAGHAPGDFFGIIQTVQDVIATDFADFMTDRKSDFYKLFNQRLNECYVGY